MTGLSAVGVGVGDAGLVRGLDRGAEVVLAVVSHAG